MATKSLMDQASELADKNKIDPFTQTFDESKGVAGRVDSLINANSSLMQTAATNGAQQAAKRGLLNSSIGVQAGQQAVINSATPIAQADASLSTQTSLANLAAKNQAATANAQMATTLGGQGMALSNSNTQQDRSLAESGRQADQGLALQGKQLDAQISQFAQNFGLSTQDLQLKRDQLSAADRQALDTLNLQKSQLAQNQAQFTTQQANNQSNFATEIGQKDKQFAQNQAQFTTQQANNQSNFATEIGQKDKQFADNQKQQIVIASMDIASREKLETIKTANQSSLQNSVNVSNAWTSMMSNISTLQNNSALEPAAKATLIQNSIDSFQSYATFWKKLDGKTDVSDLLNFGPATKPGSPSISGGSPVDQRRTTQPVIDSNTKYYA